MLLPLPDRLNFGQVSYVHSGVPERYQVGFTQDMNFLNKTSGPQLPEARVTQATKLDPLEELWITSVVYSKQDPAP
jgi:hypothetical protein